jgi:hypothetical protein
MVHGQAADHLGAHVAELALEDAGLSLLTLRCRAGHAEVDQLHLTGIADDDVLGRYVAVNDVERLA